MGLYGCPYSSAVHTVLNQSHGCLVLPSSWISFFNIKLYIMNKYTAELYLIYYVAIP